MANEKHLEIMRQGVEAWNGWRSKTSSTTPDPSNVNLSQANLGKANLSKANLSGVILSGANLNGTYLSGTDLSHANLQNSNLSTANLNEANLNAANLSNAGLQSADFGFADLNEANLQNTNLSDARFTGAALNKANLRSANLRNVNLSHATLSKADLSEANLHRANLDSADLSGVNLCRANLNSARLNITNLERADLSHADLSETNLSETNFSSADLSNADLSSAGLYEANLSRANLYNANLTYTDLDKTNFYEANLSHVNLHIAEVLTTNFTRATLTGACIADWHIGSSTKLDSVVCDYIFRTIDEDRHFSNRLPVDPNSTFAPGEFTQRFQILTSAQETIDLTFTDGIDWQAFFRSFQELRSQYPNQHIAVQGMEEKGSAFIVRLKVETEETGPELEQMKGQIEAAQKALYENQLLLMKAQGQIEVYQDMMGVVKTLAAKPMAEVNQTFHGPVGNVAGTNYGSMTAYINQNSDDISRLLTALRETARQFPEAQKDEATMELDDLESDLSKPEKQEPKRIGKRLQRLIVAGTAAATITGGAATFSGNVNEFIQNVIELGKKVGLSIEEIQPSQR